MSILFDVVYISLIGVMPMLFRKNADTRPFLLDRTNRRAFCPSVLWSLVRQFAVCLLTLDVLAALILSGCYEAHKRQ